MDTTLTSFAFCLFLVVSLRVESWSALFMFIGHVFPLHNGGAPSASITNGDTACFFGHTERGETEEERKTGWSQTEEKGEKAQALPSSGHNGERTVFGKQA